MKEAAISLSKVTKFFGSLCAVNELSLEIHRGMVVGLLGPNGAGKSTTMSICSRLMRPDAGEVLFWNGGRHAPKTTENLSLALMPQGNALDPMLSVRDNLVYYCKLIKLSRESRAREIEKVVRIFGLSDILPKSVFAISGGQYRRAQLARTFVGDPQYLLLDEPTLGIDVQGKIGIWQSIRALTQSGLTTVLLASNDLTEVREVCDEIAFINNGRLLYCGSPNHLPDEGAITLDCVLAKPFQSDHLESTAGVQIDVRDDRLVTLRFHKYSNDVLNVLKDLSSQFGLCRMTEELTSLTSLFRKYGGM